MYVCGLVTDTRLNNRCGMVLDSCLKDNEFKYIVQFQITPNKLESWTIRPGNLKPTQASNFYQNTKYVFKIHFVLQHVYDFKFSHFRFGGSRWDPSGYPSGRSFTLFENKFAPREPRPRRVIIFQILKTFFAHL